MIDVRRLLFVLRKGPRAQRLQAWGGLVLFAGAALWVVYKILLFLFPILAAVVVALIGVVLIRRAIRSAARPPAPDQGGVRGPASEPLRRES
jgi:xanthine/uracil permease